MIKVCEDENCSAIVKNTDKRCPGCGGKLIELPLTWDDKPDTFDIQVNTGRKVNE